MNYQNFTQAFSNAGLENYHGWSDSCKANIELWLNFAKSMDCNWYESEVRKSKDPQNIEGFLGQCKAMYYIGEIADYKIVGVEPDGKYDHKVDFSFQDKNNEKWFVEVKTRSWRSDVSKEVDELCFEQLIKNGIEMRIVKGFKQIGRIECPWCQEEVDLNFSNTMPEIETLHEEIKITTCSQCKKKPWDFFKICRSVLKKKLFSNPANFFDKARFIDKEVRIDSAIKEAINQFDSNKNNLLIICPELFEFSGVGISTAFENGHTVETLVRKHDLNKIISSIVLLDIDIKPQETNFIPISIQLKKQPILQL